MEEKHVKETTREKTKYMLHAMLLMESQESNLEDNQKKMMMKEKTWKSKIENIYEEFI